MSRPFLYFVVSTAVVLAGCADAPEGEFSENSGIGEDVGETSPDNIVLTVEGIRTNEDDPALADAITFGTPRTAAVAFVQEFRGEPSESEDNTLCPAGPMDFTRFDNLTLSFQGDVLVGWSLSDTPGDPTIVTPNGLTIGSSRATVNAAPQVVFEETSLGIEFTADGVDGVMTEDGSDGVVQNLWAGTVCIFR